MLLLVVLCGLLLCVPVRNATSQRLLVDTVHGVEDVLEVRAVVQRFDAKAGVLKVQQSSAWCGTQTSVEGKETHRMNQKLTLQCSLEHTKGRGGEASRHKRHLLVLHLLSSNMKPAEQPGEKVELAPESDPRYVFCEPRDSQRVIYPWP